MPVPAHPFPPDTCPRHLGAAGSGERGHGEIPPAGAQHQQLQLLLLPHPGGGRSASQALASVFPVGPRGPQILAEASEGLWGLWETVNWQLGSVEQTLGEGPLGRQLQRSRGQDLDRGDHGSTVSPWQVLGQSDGLRGGTLRQGPPLARLEQVEAPSYLALARGPGVLTSPRPLLVLSGPSSGNQSVERAGSQACWRAIW